jgi:CheY-like chemotaxis protein
MDINMPVMDGYMATQKIRDHSRFDRLPIVAFTAFVLDSEVEKVFASGMNAFLQKPLNLGKLYSAFNMFIGAEIADERKNISSVAQKKIDGLDIREGIRLASGSEALYIEVLKEFLEAYGESGELFGKLVREKRFEQIKMLTLDMKGLTGTIGAKDMYREVDEIYKLFIYNNQSKLPLHVDIYTKELSRLKQAISQYLEEESAVLESTY